MINLIIEDNIILELRTDLLFIAIIKRCVLKVISITPNISIKTFEEYFNNNKIFLDWPLWDIKINDNYNAIKQNTYKNQLSHLLTQTTVLIEVIEI